MYKLSPKLSKEWVLSRITQEQIFEFYLGITVQTKKLIRSPLRKDEHPTCSFKYFNGNLVFKDFNGHFSGNCFTLVIFMYSISYYQALEKISADFKLINSTIKIKYVAPKSKEKHYTPTKSNIEIKRKQLDKLDIEYWGQFNIIPEILKKYNVFSLQNCWVNSNLIYSFHTNDRAYAYYFGNNEFKVYFPSRRIFRFVSNTQAIQGYNQLDEEGNLLVITKSLKDVMTLRSFGINSIALQNEIVLPKKDLIYELQQRFDKIYLFYDFDLTGIRTSNKIKRLHGIKPLFLTNGRFNSINQGAKDISDYCKLKGSVKTNKLINNYEK